MRGLVFFFFMLLPNAPAPAQDVLIISHPDNGIGSLDQKDLKKIYLNKKSRWENGSPVVPVTLESGEAHRAFLKAYIHKNSVQFSTFWKRLIFTGQGIPPTSFNTEEEVVAYVASTPGAIGYVSGKAPLKGVRAVAVR